MLNDFAQCFPMPNSKMQQGTDCHLPRRKLFEMFWTTLMRLFLQGAHRLKLNGLQTEDSDQPCYKMAEHGRLNLHCFPNLTVVSVEPDLPTAVDRTYAAVSGSVDSEPNGSGPACARPACSGPWIAIYTSQRGCVGNMSHVSVQWTALTCRSFLWAMLVTLVCNELANQRPLTTNNVVTTYLPDTTWTKQRTENAILYPYKKIAFSFCNNLVFLV